jgi:hypothetical protein
MHDNVQRQNDNYRVHPVKQADEAIPSRPYWEAIRVTAGLRGRGPRSAGRHVAVNNAGLKTRRTGEAPRNDFRKSSMPPCVSRGYQPDGP